MKEERKRKERQINSEEGRKEGRKERNMNSKEFIHNYKIKKSCTLARGTLQCSEWHTDRQTD